ncbi:MAG: ABC transporter ATP-binding protein [Actinomycetota bacterium]|nr:ABC transporter ATP-binding protein [Actinomycetota bacterium]
MALLEVDRVTVRFSGVVALADVCLSVDAGRVVGLIGPNGAGKTTLFDVVTGLRAPTSGRVRFAGRDVTGEPARTRARRGIGRTFQRLEVFGSLSVGDNIRVAAEMRALRDRTAPRPELTRDRLLDRVGLWPFADVPADAVPTGIARLTELARALAGEPALLLLDEPSSGLDEQETQAFTALVRSLTVDDGMAVLLVEHDVELVMSVCSTIYVLDVGTVIAAGTPGQIRSDRGVQDAYLGGVRPASAGSEVRT